MTEQPRQRPDGSAWRKAQQDLAARNDETQKAGRRQRAENDRTQAAQRRAAERKGIQR